MTSTDRPILTTLQSAIRAALGRPAFRSVSCSRRRRTEASEPARLYDELVRSGDRLLEALNVEKEYAGLDLNQDRREQLEQWRRSRGSVEQLARNYASLVAEWRTRVREECDPPASRERLPRRGSNASPSCYQELG